MSQQKILAIKGGNTTKVVYNGRHYIRSGEQADELYQAAIKAKADPTEENLRMLDQVIDPFSQEVANGQLIRDEDGKYYLPDTNVSLPPTMVNHIRELVDQGAPIDPIVNFRKQVMLNPNSQARQHLWDYVRDYGITITDNGYMVLYKAVNNNNQTAMDEELITFIGVEWLKAKRTGKDPSDLNVVQLRNGEYDLVEGDLLTDDSITVVSEYGSPVPQEQGLMLDLASDNGIITYASRGRVINYAGSFHGIASLSDEVLDDIRSDLEEAMEPDDSEVVDLGTLQKLYEAAQQDDGGQFEPSSVAFRKKGSHGLNISLGEPQTQPRESCDPNPRVSCSRGLHVGSYDYVSGYGRNMDTILATLVSPRDVVAVPQSQNSKMRTCKYVPYAIMDRDHEGYWEEIDSVYIPENYVEDTTDLKEQLEALSTKDILSDVQQDQKKILEQRLKDITSESVDTA